MPLIGGPLLLLVLICFILFCFKTPLLMNMACLVALCAQGPALLALNFVIINICVHVCGCLFIPFVSLI